MIILKIKRFPELNVKSVLREITCIVILEEVIVVVSLKF